MNTWRGNASGLGTIMLGVGAFLHGGLFECMMAVGLAFVIVSTIPD